MITLFSGKKNDPTVLDNEQYVVSSEEYAAQEIEIESDCWIEIKARVKRGQDVGVTILEKADFEWARKEKEPLDKTNRTVVSSTQQRIVENFKKGTYIIYMAPIDSDGKSSQIELSAGVADKVGGGGLFSGSLFTSGSDKLDPTVPLGMIVAFAPFGYILSLSNFSGFVGTLGSQPIGASIGSLLIYLIFVFPLLFGVYLDARKTRAVSDFPENLKQYMIVLLIPVINIIGLYMYVRQRNKVRVE